VVPALAAIYLPGLDSRWQASSRARCPASQRDGKFAGQDDEEIEMAGRLCVPVESYMLLERDGRILILRRAAGATYAAGLLCPPSEHAEAGETVSDAAIRETAEETGVRLRPYQVRCVTVVHHRGPGSQAR
jgi:8-oxo-dGTP pyrophosphatase MutT (NUDIX family)